MANAVNTAMDPYDIFKAGQSASAGQNDKQKRSELEKMAMQARLAMGMDWKTLLGMFLGRLVRGAWDHEQEARKNRKDDAAEEEWSKNREGISGMQGIAGQAGETSQAAQGLLGGGALDAGILEGRYPESYQARARAALPWLNTGFPITPQGEASATPEGVQGASLLAGRYQSGNPGDPLANVNLDWLGVNSSQQPVDANQWNATIEQYLADRYGRTQRPDVLLRL